MLDRTDRKPERMSGKLIDYITLDLSAFLGVEVIEVIVFSNRVLYVSGLLFVKIVTEGSKPVAYQRQCP